MASGLLYELGKGVCDVIQQWCNNGNTEMTSKVYQRSSDRFTIVFTMSTPAGTLKLPSKLVHLLKKSHKVQGCALERKNGEIRLVLDVFRGELDPDDMRPLFQNNVGKLEHVPLSSKALKAFRAENLDNVTSDAQLSLAAHVCSVIRVNWNKIFSSGAASSGDDLVGFTKPTVSRDTTTVGDSRTAFITARCLVDGDVRISHHVIRELLRVDPFNVSDVNVEIVQKRGSVFAKLIIVLNKPENGNYTWKHESVPTSSSSSTRLRKTVTARFGANEGRQNAFMAAQEAAKRARQKSRIRQRKKFDGEDNDADASSSTAREQHFSFAP